MVDDDMVDDENEGKRQGSPVMETVLLCLHGLSRSSMSKDDKIQVCEKIFESFSCFSNENQEENNINVVQAWEGEENLLHDGKRHEERSENEDDKLTAEKVSPKHIISMLFKAVRDGVLQLKDVQNTLQELQTRSHEEGEEIGKMKNSLIHAIDEANSLPFEAARITEESKGENRLKDVDVHQGPPVINQADTSCTMVSKGATATRQREPCPSIGSPCKKTANQVNQQKATCFSSFPADGQAANVPKMTLFPEMVEQSTKGKAQVFQQEVKDNSTFSFSDLLKLGPKDVNASTIFSDSTSQMQKFSDNGIFSRTKEGQRKNTSFSSSLLNVLPSSASLMHNDGLKRKKDGAPLSYAEAISAKHHPKSSGSPSLHGQSSEMEDEGGSLVKVPSETLQRRLDLCKLSVIGRVILGKGEEIWPTKKLRERLNEV